MPYWIYVTASAFLKFLTYQDGILCQLQVQVLYITTANPGNNWVSREEVVQLCCRKTHQVKPKTTYVKEDDTLYSILTIHVGQNPAFMQTWLKLYVGMYWCQFKRVGEEYLKLKVLDFDLWHDSIKDGHKGDIMVLLGLNYLMGMHTMVHLSGNRVWSTLLGNLTHDELLNRCDFHLHYLGRGTNAELVKCSEPLAEVSDQDDTLSFVVGTLTNVEDTVINKLVHLGLGFGIDRTSNTEPEPGTSTELMTTEITPDEPSTSTVAFDQPQPLPSSSLGGSNPGKSCSTGHVSLKGDHEHQEHPEPKAAIKLEKIQVGLTEHIKVTTEMLESLPKSCYAHTDDIDDTNLNV